MDTETAGTETEMGGMVMADFGVVELEMGKQQTSRIIIVDQPV
jgi:hypothetical protein